MMAEAAVQNGVRRTVQAELGEPILFRTTSADVALSTLSTGSIWLRSGVYYRELEDQVRRDKLEGVNGCSLTVPLRLSTIEISGPGHVGQEIVPHYIFSMHGASLSQAEWLKFGNATFGIRSIFKLAMEIWFRANQILPCGGFRYGSVQYQHAGLTVSTNPVGSSPIGFGSDPPKYLGPMDTDVLRKQPIAPFIEQDEWRIAIFTDGYLEGDPLLPLTINVAPDHFYEYLSSPQHSERDTA